MKTTNIENLYRMEHQASQYTRRRQAEDAYRAACVEEAERVKQIIDESDDDSIERAIAALSTWRRHAKGFAGVDAAKVRATKGLQKPVASWLYREQTGRELPDSPVLEVMG